MSKATCNICKKETVNNNKIGFIIHNCDHCGTDDIKVHRLWMEGFSKMYIYQCQDCVRGVKGYSSIGKSDACIYCHSKDIIITMIFDHTIDRWVNVETGEEVLNKNM
jgi:hypothetical protein